MRKGMLIALEGNECSGKSSVLCLLKDLLEREGKSVVVFREPGGTVAGEDIRSIILDNLYEETINGRTEAYLYAASRSELVEKRVLPALETCDYVLLDRYYYSSIVWQGVIRGLGIPLIESLNAPFMKEAKPDLAIFLDISEEERLRRMAIRVGKHDRLDNEPLELLSRLDTAYREMVRRFPEFKAVSAEGPVDVVATRCLDMIRKTGAGTHSTGCSDINCCPICKKTNKEPETNVTESCADMSVEVTI